MTDPVTPVVLKGLGQGIVARLTHSGLSRIFGGGERWHYHTVVEFLKSSICDAQLDICDFQSRLAVRDEALRKALSIDDTNARDKTRKINRLKKEVKRFRDTRLTIFGYMSEFVEVRLKEYYRIVNRSSGCSPRVCMKLFANEEVIDAYRKPDDSPEGYGRIKIDANTGFRKIYKGARAFVENDIPRAARDKSPYLNSRLSIVQNWADYKPPGRYARFKMSRLEKKHCDDKWRACWKDGHSLDRNYKSFYKSTLIVPMTVRAQIGNFSPDAESKLESNTSDKLLYGFICIDHVRDHFFSRKPIKDSLSNSRDVNIAIIFADLMTILCVQLKIHTTATSDYAAACEYLEKNDSEWLANNSEEAPQIKA